MESLQSHRVEMISIAVALVAIGAGTAFYFYITKKPKGCLDPENFKEYELVKRTELSHNVAKFKFALPTPIQVVKPYTPTTLDSDIGYFELVIKMYPQGRMSHHFREMREGDYMAVKGPKGRFKYQPNQVRAFGMIAGGTGITPMFQVTRAILENPDDKTTIHLIYANVTYEDILLKEEIDNLATIFPNQFNVYYPPEGWEGGVGFISKEMIQSRCPRQHLMFRYPLSLSLPPCSPSSLCGPPPMNKAMAAHLNDLGYTSQMQFQF
ncbi:NADH--cytochrome b5 reductase [Salix suchowensis]|nr:NADH--cytochrome b5 reductase [Salix suchowensis]